MWCRSPGLALAVRIFVLLAAFSSAGALAADEALDAVSREFTLFNDPVSFAEYSDAVSREFTLFNDPVSFAEYADAVSREFTLFNDPVSFPEYVDAVSREFTLFNDPVSFPEYTDAVSREFTIYNGPVNPGQLRRVADGVPVETLECVVTAAFEGFFYIEAQDRSAGIRVALASHGMLLGNLVKVVGTMATNSDGERYVQASAPPTLSGSGSVAPLGMNNRWIGGGPSGLQAGVVGGQGVNSIGLLVRATGRAASVGSGDFRIDDGSTTGSVRVLLPPGVSPPAENTTVVVDAVVSMEKLGDGFHPLLLARRAEDIVSVGR